METRDARCPWCGHAAGLVWVHGHAQCAACKLNVEPCCGGAPVPEESGPAPEIPTISKTLF